MSLTFDIAKANIATLQSLCFGLAKAKGFHDKPVTLRGISEKLLLIVSELVEAQDELRKGLLADDLYTASGKTVSYNNDVAGLIAAADRGEKPEGFAVELADALIRILDLAGSLELPLQEIIEAKLTYNATRSYKHGKAF